MVNEKQFRIDLGRNVSRIRREHKFTQEDLAEKVGIHRVTLARIETGRVTPPSTVLINLAQVLGVSSDTLVLR